MLQLPQVILNVVLQLSRTLPLHERSGSKLKHNSVFTTAKATELWRQFQALIELSLTFTKRHQCVKSVDKCSVACAAKAASERAQNDAAILQLPLLLNTWLTYHVLISCHWMPSLFVRFQLLLLLLLLPPCLHPQHSAIEEWCPQSREPVSVYLTSQVSSLCVYMYFAALCMYVFTAARTRRSVVVGSRHWIVCKFPLSGYWQRSQRQNGVIKTLHWSITTPQQRNNGDENHFCSKSESKCLAMIVITGCCYIVYARSFSMKQHWYFGIQVNPNNNSTR